jgi:hypothetical protein
MVKSYLTDFCQGRKVKILFARILASTKLVKSYFLEFQQGRKVKIIFARILASTENGQILFDRILARKKGENPIC